MACKVEQSAKSARRIIVRLAMTLLVANAIFVRKDLGSHQKAPARPARLTASDARGQGYVRNAKLALH